MDYKSLVVTTLGAIKLAGEAFGYHLINDVQINAIANLVAVGLTLAGIFMSHRKKTSL
jgi:hypothetical protein